MAFNPRVMGPPQSPPIRPPQPGPGQEGPSNPLPPGPTQTPGPVYKPPTGDPGIDPNGNGSPGIDTSPGYRPPTGSPPILPGPGPGAPPPGGDPYGSDNWKTGTGVGPSGSTGSSTSNPNMQLTNAGKKAPGSPPIRPPSIPSSGTTLTQLGTASGPEYPQKEAERNRVSRRSGTNFGIREKMAKGGVSGYTRPQEALTGSGQV